MNSLWTRIRTGLALAYRSALQSFVWRRITLEGVRYDSRLVLGFGALILLAVAACLQSIWLARQVEFYSERSRLADQVVIGYHQLKADIIELQSLLTEPEPRTFELLAQEGRLFDTLEKRTSHIRQLIASEVLLVGQEETDELATLSKIDVIISSVAYEYRNGVETDAPERRKRALARLRGALQDQREGGLRALLAEEIEDEARESAAAEGRLKQVARQAASLAKVIGLAGLMFGLASLFVLVRGLRQPLSALVSGTEAIARGDLAHRVDIGGTDEFANVAASFNNMAADLARKNEEVKRAASKLEQIVQERTQALKIANETLQRADSSRRRFLADISHELRTPLTIMRGEAEVALRGLPKTQDEYQNALRRIVEQAGHTTSLVEDLLFLARREGGDTRLKQQSVPFPDLITKVCDEATVLGAEKEVEVTCACSVQAAVVTGDPTRLRQMALILLDNAIRYSHAHSVVSVRVLPGADCVVLVVADQGIGIAQDELPRVFERYYRGDNANALHLDGTGLGLPMAKVIAEAHGGSIELTSDIGRGTTVTVSLPTVRRMRAVS